MRVCRSAYYDWLKWPAEVVTAEALNMNRRVKLQLKQSRQNHGNREMTKNPREEGFAVGRYRVFWSKRCGFWGNTLPL